MLYKKSRSVPANTAAIDPDSQKLDISKGVIEQWVVLCPPECVDLMKFRVFYHGHQILPASADEWMDPLTHGAPINEKLQINDPPFVLDIYAYNNSASKTHEYNLYVNVIPEAPMDVLDVSQSLIDRIIDFFKGE